MLVRGKEGTTVTLTIERAHQEHTLKIKRNKIHVKSVEYKKEGNVYSCTFFTANHFNYICK